MAESQPSNPGAKLSPTHPLFEIVESAYRVFACLKPKDTGVCVGCCMKPAIEADFFNPGIRELPLSYIQDWFSAAYAPDGVPQDIWQYLLPRILEILACGDDASQTGLPVVLSRFDTGNELRWSPEKWAILDAFERRYLSHFVSNRIDMLDDAICMFSRGGWALQDLLDQIMLIPDDRLIPMLWHDWCDGRAHGIGSIGLTAFWESPERQTMFQFYTSVDLHSRAESVALSDDVLSGLAAQASDVVSVIEANADWCS